jgi:prolyl-tRNA editing enzyme YbaK/EbsC (Cys-tRNA(Pro) deacylase)
VVLSREPVRRVAAALTAAGLDAASLIRVLPVTGNTAATAAAALNCSTGAIANSLIFTGADKKPLLVLTSGGHRVDTRALGERLGWSKSAIKRAKPELVKSATGYSIGGVAPVGHPEPIRTIVDEELRNYPESWAAAGHHQAVFPIGFDKLVEITGGEVMKVD